MAGQQVIEWWALKVAFLSLVAFLLIGCATTEPRIVIKQVKVPVPVARAVPPELAKCGSDRPGFRFHGTTDPKFRTGIDQDGERKLREWVDSKDRCIQAWRTWASP